MRSELTCVPKRLSRRPPGTAAMPRDALQLVAPGVLEARCPSRPPGPARCSKRGFRPARRRRRCARRCARPRRAVRCRPARTRPRGGRSAVEAELGQRLADGHRAADGASRPVEGGEEPVARGVDLSPSVTGELAAHGGVMPVNEGCASAASPRPSARSVDPTMSLNRTVASTRSGSGITSSRPSMKSSIAASARCQSLEMSTWSSPGSSIACASGCARRNTGRRPRIRIARARPWHVDARQDRVDVRVCTSSHWARASAAEPLASASSRSQRRRPRRQLDLAPHRATISRAMASVPHPSPMASAYSADRRRVRTADQRPGRRPQHEAGGPLGVSRGEHAAQGGSVREPNERDALRTDRIQDGAHVVEPMLERRQRVVIDAVGEPRPAPVEPHDPPQRAQPAVDAGQDRLLPLVVEVGVPGTEDQDVDRARRRGPGRRRGCRPWCGRSASPVS